MSAIQESDSITTIYNGSSSQKAADDDSVYHVVEDALFICVPLLLSVCGVISNLCNVIIFGKLGVKDSMSTNVFALSLTDFITTLLQTVVSLCYVANRLYPSSLIDTWSLGSFAFQWMENAIYLISCWITAMITIERCFCVVFPFKVKQIFTRFRSVTSILAIYIFHIGLHVVIYTTHKMQWVETCPKSVTNNITKPPVLVFTAVSDEDTAKVEEIFNIVISLAFSDLSFVIVIACTAWMVHKLHATATVRLVLSPHSEGDPQKSQLSSKERKLVKVALALAVTLTACSLPRVVVVTVQSLIPHKSITSMPRYISIMWAVAYICTTFGSSITIVVHLVLNNNYRTLLISALNAIGRCLSYRTFKL